MRLSEAPTKLVLQAVLGSYEVQQCRRLLLEKTTEGTREAYLGLV